ncbi:diguanylate cyclase (GGDEF) domain-containing protein [Geopseudomonas sagittaria]|uniref:diguanylate cyclase n=1 Tax=Geopseudomonas sagittaria TaxID=1135990 RepID=A0A1I5URG6_9GAMM|nr:GGDEF domain-containing protein [Pseudomonas sagittaria]SFP97627.1 diguanylate cyclase (GGDEF) domain-containing protein [Pseudomonas sagittaria]
MTHPPPHAHFRPRLATTVRLGLSGLLLFSLAVWLSLPLLGGIVDKANQVRDEYLPDLTRWRYNTQRTEQLYGFIQTLYWSNDAQVARSSRLQAQVLLDSFAFEPGNALAAQATRILLDIQTLARLRDSQRATLHEVQTLAGALLRDDAISDDSARFAASCTRLGLIGTDWQALRQEADQLQTRLPAGPAKNALAELQSRFTQLQALETQVGQTYQQALGQQKQLAATLNTDTALKTQQIAMAVEKEANQVRHYGLLTMLLFGAITLAMLYAFQRFLLRPILHCTQALEQLNTRQTVHLPGRTLFHELDTICQSVSQYSDMTRQQQHVNQELMQLSQQDGLTGLSNRRHFDNVLAVEHARACRHAQDLALILIDIDHFKALNDRYGHLFGDDCLRQLAGVLRRFSRRPGDLAARYGGEEFALILPGMNLEQSRQLAERVRQAIAELTTPTDSGEVVHFTASAGLIHTSNAPRHTPESLIHQADLALYRAKQLGRNRVEVAGEAVPQS